MAFNCLDQINIRNGALKYHEKCIYKTQVYRLLVFLVRNILTDQIIVYQWYYTLNSKMNLTGIQPNLGVLVNNRSRFWIRIGQSDYFAFEWRAEFRLSLPVRFAESPLGNYHGTTNPSPNWNFTKWCNVTLTNENLWFHTSGQVSQYS